MATGGMHTLGTWVFVERVDIILGFTISNSQYLTLFDLQKWQLIMVSTYFKVFNYNYTQRLTNVKIQVHRC